jgi:exonuclease III
LSNDDHISALSINIQSLPAKFNELKELIDLFDSKKCLPDVILLQEIWHIADPNLFMLNYYHPLIFKCRAKAQGGGVGMYIKNDYKFKINPHTVFWDRVFESLIVDIWINDKLLVVGSLYRCINHPTLTVKEQFNEFSEIFNNLLGNLSSFELLLGGDLNLDALKINTCPLVSSYLDSLYANGFIQSVTKLTRCNMHRPLLNQLQPRTL